MEKRRSGILQPVSSLPGTLGIGDFGKTAYEWVDALAEAKVSLWQILPLNPVGYGNSPYQPYSSFAGDEIYISIEDLYEDLGLSYRQENVICASVNYEQVRARKNAYLEKAYEHFTINNAYREFEEKAFWLDDYARFRALKKKNHHRWWIEWTEEEVSQEAIDYEKFLQYVFYQQWMKLKRYANEKGVFVIGDIPIYVGHDSSDVYFYRKYFILNEKGHPREVAGVPPDNFSEDGQLWGNPLYDWDALKQDDYRFWVDRLTWNQELFDVIRIDHFRAFDTYWAVPFGEKTARNGEWRLGPAYDFFDAIFRQIPDLKLIVEDLGDLRPEVLTLRDHYNFMGMKIIQFALKEHEIKECLEMPENFVAYPGTHDNKTLLGILESEHTDESKAIIRHHMPRLGQDLCEQILYHTMALNARWSIIPLQDLMKLDDRARINTPATLGSPNWEWKLKRYDQQFAEGMALMKKMVQVSNRK